MQHYLTRRQLLSLEKVHAAGVVHRDVKPGNIFLDVAGNLVLGDFGLAAFADDLVRGPKEFSGTPEYVAREVWQQGGGGYSYASDVWAYGAVVFELAVGRVSISSLVRERCADSYAAPVGLVQVQVFQGYGQQGHYWS